MQRRTLMGERGGGYIQINQILSSARLIAFESILGSKENGQAQLNILMNKHSPPPNVSV